MDTQDGKLSALRDILAEMGSVLVAYSGGVDSTFLLWAALDTLGAEHVLAVTASSPVIQRRELAEAAELAGRLGARHRLVPVTPREDERFLQNPPDRCYLCKRHVLARLLAVAREEGLAQVVEGSNASDAGDYRPGAQAVRELGVRSPLQEAGLTKAEIRALSRQAGLPTWDKPAQPCLATRFPYNTPLTAAGLARVEAAEAALAELGFRGLRVRDHWPIARIEVVPQDVAHLARADVAAQAVTRLKALGYTYVTLDLEGYRQGSIDSEQMKRQMTK